MFGSTIKSEGDHDRFRSKADRVNVMTRMTREERMAKVDEKHGGDRDKDSDDDLDSDWSDSSDDDSPARGAAVRAAAPAPTWEESRPAHRGVSLDMD